MTAQETIGDNFFSTTLVSGISDTDVEYQLDDIGNLSSPAFLVFDPENENSKREVILADGTWAGSTAKSSSTSKRNLKGSASGGPFSHGAGTIVVSVPLIQYIEDLHDRIDAHVHDGNTDDATVAHSDLSGLTTSAADHTDLMPIDGSTDFTGKVGGVATAAGDADTTLATKGYVDARMESGTIVMYGAASAPSGWLLCDGSAVSRTTYADLFAVIGTTWGNGDGSTTFNVPNFQNRFPVGSGDTYSANDQGGANSVTLTTAQMPSHTHTGPSHTHSVNPPATNTDSDTHSHGPGSYTVYNVHKIVTDADATGVAERARSTGANEDFAVSGTSATDQHNHSVNISSFNSGSAGTGSTGTAGSGDSHENRPPYIGVPFIIKT